jgi:hypothetical protein
MRAYKLVNLAGSYLERVVVAIEASVEMRLVTAWMGQIVGVRLLLLSQAVALSSRDCEVWDLGRRERMVGGDAVGERDILCAFLWM